MKKINFQYSKNNRENAEFLKIIRGQKERFRYLTDHITSDQRSFLSDEKNYDEFLSSLYWFIVKSHKIYLRGNRCERCGRVGSILHVHHITYARKGYEYKHPEDLEVLCKSCHEVEHAGSEQIKDLFAVLAGAKKQY